MTRSVYSRSVPSFCWRPGGCARLSAVPAYSDTNSINPGVTSGVNAQGYKVPLVPSEARLPLLVGWESLSGEQQAAVRAVCHAKTQGANATPKPAARPDPMAWAPPATTSKVANGKKRKLEPSPTGPPQPQLPLPIVAGYVVEPPPQPLPLPVVEGYILVVD